jgi:hypothetical protein
VGGLAEAINCCQAVVERSLPLTGIVETTVVNDPEALALPAED